MLKNYKKIFVKNVDITLKNNYACIVYIQYQEITVLSRAKCKRHANVSVSCLFELLIVNYWISIIIGSIVSIDN